MTHPSVKVKRWWWWFIHYLHG